MNLFGSYKSLIGNSISAMLSGIEIYNKPRIEYRSECFVILLLNSWELLFKAICSKNKVRIFEAKKRDQPYKTLTLWDAFKSASPFLPKDIPIRALQENIAMLVDYRNNAVHFYNEESLGILIYGLAQTAIVNYKDIVLNIFNKDISSEVNISLLPLSFSTPPDPIKFLGNPSKQSEPIAEFLKVISNTTGELEKDGIDTGRFLTVFEVTLQSTKKIASADIVAGLDNSPNSGVLLLTKSSDPNKTHPYNLKTSVERIKKKKRNFNNRSAQAITWKYSIKENSRYCWNNENTGTFQYSNEFVSFCNSLNDDEIEKCRSEYSKHLKKKRTST